MISDIIKKKGLKWILMLHAYSTKIYLNISSAYIIEKENCSRYIRNHHLKSKNTQNFDISSFGIRSCITDGQLALPKFSLFPSLSLFIIHSLPPFLLFFFFVVYFSLASNNLFSKS